MTGVQTCALPISRNRLPYVEQGVAERVVAALTPKSILAVQARDCCNYCFDLDGARPSLRLTRSTPVSAATRYFDGTGVHQALLTMIATLSKTGDTPKGFDPSLVADLVMIGRAMRHWQINWAKVLPSRAHGRRRKAASRSVVYGWRTCCARSIRKSAKGSILRPQRSLNHGWPRTSAWAA